MNAEELIKIQEAIRDTVGIAIQAHVNGKITKLTVKLDEYIKEDNEWKERANPTIELGNNIRGFNKGLVYVLGITGALFGVGKAVVEFIRYFNK